jgi:hypothetical protein
MLLGKIMNFFKNWKKKERSEDKGFPLKNMLARIILHIMK